MASQVGNVPIEFYPGATGWIGALLVALMLITFIPHYLSPYRIYWVNTE